MSSTSIRRREHHTGAFTAGFSQPSMSTRTPEIHQATASQIQTSHTILALDRPAQLAHGGEAVLSPLQQIPNEQDEIIDEVIMALGLGERSSMGCAYFSTADATLHVAEDVAMATLEVADQFISQIEPTTLLVSARAPRFMLDFLEAKAESQLDAEPNGFILRALGSQDFSYSSAIDRLATLEFDRFSHVGAVVTTSNERQSTSHDSETHRRDAASESACTKVLRCGSFINLDSHASVSCAGAVLGDLHRRRSVGFLPNGHRAGVVFQVRSLNMFAMSDYMVVSSETMLALQILQSELHPNCQTWGPDLGNSSSKESLSVYGLFHALASTAQGRKILRQMFLRPTRRLSIIAERQRSISSLLRPENSELVKQAIGILRKMKNVKVAVSQLRKGVDSPISSTSFDRGVWATVRGFAAQVLRLRELAGSFMNSEHIVGLCKLAEAIPPSAFMAIGDIISRTVDFEQSKSRNRSSIKPGLDPKLDELKRRYDGVSSFLTKAVNDSSRHLAPETRKRIKSCIFLPQLGFLLVVETDPNTHDGQYDNGDEEGEQWEKVFTADGSVCYKNEAIRELDKSYGDMYCEIGDREVEIMHRLAKHILEYEQLLVSASELCGQFDAILALALGAERYAWVAPQMTNTNSLSIKNGRHPLQELIVPAFIPNDCQLSGHNGEETSVNRDIDAARAIVLTGPNHSGKSIYLKQTAIIVYLAHIGSFVPADKAVIGLTDKILTRISTRESVARCESAFAIDLKQAARAMRCSTSRSLLLINEFGKGTNADDGAGLLAAMLNYFLDQGLDTPRLLLATHFHELLEGRYLESLRGLHLAHMDVTADPSTGHDELSITYLFKLAEGHSACSFGANCAALNGVSGEIVLRAEAINRLLYQNEELSSACRKLSSDEENRLQESEEVARRFLRTTFTSGGSGSLAMKDVLKGILSLSL